MSETTCPRCGKKAGGRFCSWCGAALDERFCNQCGAELEAGARFCNQCGAPLAKGVAPAGATAAGAATGAGTRGGGRGAEARGAGGGGSQLAWWVAGAAMVGLILIIAYPVIREDPGSTGIMTPGAGASPADASPGAGPSSVDIFSMTPREAADQLFNRVMRAAEAGDSAQVTGFLPMSIQAYERARPLDADGFFHLALLQRTGGDFQAALATAQEALTENPNHLLILSVAAQSAQVLGDDAAAREYYQRLLSAWDEELARDLPEYDAENAHGGMLPGLRQEAEDFLGR